MCGVSAGGVGGRGCGVGGRVGGCVCVCKQTWNGF